MNEISRHLVKLLLDHNCVIIPDLGGFIAQYIPAEYREDDYTYQPPQRIVSFNQELTLNDGLLIQSLMQTYDTTFPETLKMLEDAVIDMKEELYEKGELDLVGVGVLRLNLEGNYEFEPHQHGIVSPETYGLTHVSMKAFAEGAVSYNLQSDKYTFSISKKVVNYAAAAVVSAFFFLGWAVPMQKGDVNVGHQQAQVLGSGFNWGNTDDHTRTAKVNVKVPEKAKKSAQVAASAPVSSPVPASAAPKTAVTAQDTPTAQEANAEKGGFTIVVSCGLPQKYADRLISNLQKDGLNDAKAEAEGKYMNVVYGNYSSRAEAEAFLKQVAGNKRFKHAQVKEQ